MNEHALDLPQDTSRPSGGEFLSGSSDRGSVNSNAYTLPYIGLTYTVSTTILHRQYQPRVKTFEIMEANDTESWQFCSAMVEINYNGEIIDEIDTELHLTIGQIREHLRNNFNLHL